MTTDRLDQSEFESLLGRLSAAWEACDAEAAASCFADDAVYMEPPDRQLFRGRAELLAYFSPLQPGTYLDIHSVWFDPGSQTGAAEFSFGLRGQDSADHGVITVGLDNGRVGWWREYHRKGPAGFDRFVATEDKAWDWHAGNYP